MFNSLKYIKKLEEAGCSREQAEAHLNIMWEVMNDSLATKKDLELLATKQDIYQINIRFEKIESRFDLLETKMTIRLGIMLIGAVTLMATLQKFL